MDSELHWLAAKHEPMRGLNNSELSLRARMPGQSEFSRLFRKLSWSFKTNTVVFGVAAWALGVDVACAVWWIRHGASIEKTLSGAFGAHRAQDQWVCSRGATRESAAFVSALRTRNSAGLV